MQYLTDLRSDIWASEAEVKCQWPGFLSGGPGENLVPSLFRVLAEFSCLLLEG